MADNLTLNLVQNYDKGDNVDSLRATHQYKIDGTCVHNYIKPYIDLHPPSFRRQMGQSSLASPVSRFLYVNVIIVPFKTRGNDIRCNNKGGCRALPDCDSDRGKGVGCLALPGCGSDRGKVGCRALLGCGNDRGKGGCLALPVCGSDRVKDGCRTLLGCPPSISWPSFFISSRQQEYMTNTIKRRNIIISNMSSTGFRV